MERKKRPIDSLFPAVRQQILATTLLAPERRWYLSELAARINVTPSSLQRELQSLSEAGILSRFKDGQRAYYQADQSCPIYPELHGLMKKSLGAIDALKEALAPFAGDIDVAFVYGSYVSLMQVKNSSDIDLMVVGRATPLQLSSALSQVEQAIGREVNPTVYTLEEFNEKRLKGHHFITSVLDKETLPIIGDKDVLAAASDPRQD